MKLVSFLTAIVALCLPSSVIPSHETRQHSVSTDSVAWQGRVLEGEIWLSAVVKVKGKDGKSKRILVQLPLDKGIENLQGLRTNVRALENVTITAYAGDSLKGLLTVSDAWCDASEGIESGGGTFVQRRPIRLTEWLLQRAKLTP